MTTVRIATWNLERATSPRVRERQDAVMQAVDADIWIVTEPGPSFMPTVPVMSSPARRPRPDPRAEAWVAITAPRVADVTLEIPFERMATAAFVEVRDRPVVVYGSVLPWLAIANHAPDHVRAGETSLETFRRVLAEQARDISELQGHYNAPVIWAGDFNQSLSGPLAGGSDERRRALVEALASLRLTAWNADAAHAHSELRAVDLVCGPSTLVPVRIERIAPTLDGVRLSDHAGYWLDVSCEST